MAAVLLGANNVASLYGSQKVNVRAGSAVPRNSLPFGKSRGKLIKNKKQLISVQISLSSAINGNAWSLHSRISADKLKGKDVQRHTCIRCGEEPSPVILDSGVESGGGGFQHGRRAHLAHLASVATILPALPPAPAWAAEDGAGDGAAALTIEQVTPQIAPAGPLPASEEATVELFERATYSVVNIFDVSLRPQVNTTGSVEVPEGNGSGIVWDEQGHIVTNYHVIGNSLLRNPPPGSTVARITLLGSDGYQKNFEAKLVGADRTKDLAVLQVEAPAELLRRASVGQSSALKVGQRCLAIGNPFGFDHTLTTGVVSGLNRDIYSQTGVVIGGGIQTDAAINPGNSGGPLLDSRGNVIGINTAIFTRTGTSAGVGFAIPIDTVARIVPQLIAYGKVMRPGLNVQLAADGVAKQLNVKSGALVLSVPDRTAAAKAGLMGTRRGLAGNIVVGDVITAVDSTKVNNSGELAKVLDGLQVGSQVTLAVRRGDTPLEVQLVLEESKQ